MKPAPAIAAAAAAVAAAVATAVAGWPVGVAIGLVVALVAARVVTARWEDALADMARDVRSWRQERDRTLLKRIEDPMFGDLAVALETTGREFDRRLALMDESMPWRREVVEALPTPAVLFGSDGYVAAANAPARELLGIAADGEPITMLSALGSSRLASGVRRAAPRAPVGVDAQGSGRGVRAVATTVGEQRLVLVTDRTRERRVENLRRNFVVNASHELKTPVTSIQALAEALQVMLERDPTRLPGLLSRLEEESARLVQLVHDLLDLRRLEEQVRVRPQRVDVVPVLRQVLDETAETMAERGITCRAELADRAEVEADPDDLRLIVRNLVANAVQYGREGGRLDVAVGVQEPFVVVTIHDDGIGIPKADLERIFERFYRVDVARSRETGGTGLGLSLVRNAVTRAGGRIEVDSLLGSGTTFTVMLPVSGRPATDDVPGAARGDADDPTSPEDAPEVVELDVGD